MPVRFSAVTVFRNGLAHEYAVKRDCDGFMTRGRESCGIGEENGGYYFVVERYFDDLRIAVKALYEKLIDHPVIPN